MSALILDGITCSRQIRLEIAERVKALPRRPGLSVVMIGDNAASRTYVRNKQKAALEAGFVGEVRAYPTTMTQYELEQVLAALNADPAVNGYIVQLPLPLQIDVEKVVQAIDPRKDVDAFTPANQGLLARGMPSIVPATPRGILELLKRNRISTVGKRVVILGRSTIVGRPLASLLLLNGARGDATVTVAHSRTADLQGICRDADILISAMGKARFVTRDFVKPGAVVVDVGINHCDGKLCGDVDFDSVREVASAVTPVPGGVGPMTIAMLLQNTLETAESQMA